MAEIGNRLDRSQPIGLSGGVNQSTEGCSMKRDSLGWIAAGVVAVLACTLGAMQQQGAVGRYQLVEGRYQIVGEKTVVDSVSVWRIDTVTGNVDEYRTVTGGQSPGSGWVPVSDFPRRK